jgi:hypothetical protein
MYCDSHDSMCIEIRYVDVPNILLTICLLQRDKRENKTKQVLISQRNKSAENMLVYKKM